MCAHAASVIRGANKKTISTIAPRKVSCIIPTEDVILGGGGFFATNSLFYLRSLRDNPPKFYQYLGFDYSIQIWGSLRGGILYLPDNMSVYRRGVEGSWSVRMHKRREQHISHTEKVIQMLGLLNSETNGFFAESIRKMIEELHVSIMKQKILILEENQDFLQSYRQ